MKIYTGLGLGSVCIKNDYLVLYNLARRQREGFIMTYERRNERNISLSKKAATALREGFPINFTHTLH